MAKFEANELQNANIEEQIDAATNFEELYDALDRQGSLMGTDETYSSLMLRSLIEKARQAVDLMGKEPTADLTVIKTITRTAGLRNKVIDLLMAGTTPNKAAILAKLKSK